ncbi:hypothetical protein NBRC116594_12510 [Shimia sp. NS0008-38b]|uniref:hypothetical protein n=1 Tax=Shimia sp. NS0008-38b TaxID=3127653 RepID=UPI003108526A
MMLFRRTMLMGAIASISIGLSACSGTDGSSATPEVPLLSLVNVSSINVTAKRRGIVRLIDDLSGPYSDEQVIEDVQRALNSEIRDLGTGAPMTLNVQLSSMALARDFGVLSFNSSELQASFTASAATSNKVLTLYGRVQAPGENAKEGENVDEKYDILIANFANEIKKVLASKTVAPK